jgi:hypothetical protein
MTLLADAVFVGLLLMMVPLYVNQRAPKRARQCCGTKPVGEMAAWWDAAL